MSNSLKELIDEYGDAALHAGQTNSGYCFDPSAKINWSEMQRLRELLHEKVQAQINEIERLQEEIKQLRREVIAREFDGWNHPDA